MNVEDVEDGVLQLLHNIAYRVQLSILLLISKVSNTMYCTLYTGPLAPQGGRLFVI